MRGTVSGGLWGLVIGGVCLGLASQVSELPARDPDLITDTAPVLGAEIAADDVAIADVMSSGTDISDEVGTTPPVQDDVIAPPVADVTPPAVPDEVAVAPEVSAPEELSPPAIASVPDEPVAPASPVEPQAELIVEAAPKVDPEPASPVTEDIASVDVDTETAAAPIVDEGPGEPEIPAAVDDTLPVLVAPTEEVVTEPAPAEAAPVADATPEVVDDTPPQIAAPAAPETPKPAVTQEQAEADPPATEVAPDVARVDPGPEPVAPAVPEPEVDAPPETEDVATAEPPAAEPTLPGSGTAVRVNRPGAEPTEQAGQEAEIVPDTEVPEDAPALLRYATEFENPQSLPLLSLVMVDDPAIGAAPGQVAGLGFPVTVILDPLASDADARMAAYRAAGVEVGISASLPGGATPSDVEVTFEAALAAVPDAVVLFSDGEDGVQGTRSVTEQVVEVLAADGRGLVTIQRGLGNALRIAEQANVPAAVVLRDLDGDGQSASAIQRALDQAAFRARQSGDAVLLAKVSDDTLDALSDWGGKIDGDQFLLAPVTAILKNQIVTE